MTSAAPFLIFFLGAALTAVTRGTLRAIVLLAVPLAGALNLYALGEGIHLEAALFDYRLEIVRVDRLSLLFGHLFHLAAFIAILFSLRLRDTVQHVAGLLYAGSALGATFAGDLITLFVFWELLAITSVVLILARRTERANRVALRYLIIQVLSGVILLSGALVIAHETGSIEFGYIGLDGLGSWLIFLAFGIKCAFPFLHNWLTDAYPEATPTGTVFLSAFTTKVAVYALARAFPGTELLVYIGAAMTMFPIFFAVIENDLRRVLAYSMINQIGFMVCGIGIGTALAVNGAVTWCSRACCSCPWARCSIAPARSTARPWVGFINRCPRPRPCASSAPPRFRRFRCSPASCPNPWSWSPSSRRATRSSGWRCCSPPRACSTTPASRSRSSPSSATIPESAVRRRRATC